MGTTTAGFTGPSATFRRRCSKPSISSNEERLPQGQRSTNQVSEKSGAVHQRLRRRKHMNVALLVIDEVGFEPMTRQEASLFFRLVSYRYGRGSMLITTHKGSSAQGLREWTSGEVVNKKNRAGGSEGSKGTPKRAMRTVKLIGGLGFAPRGPHRDPRPSQNALHPPR